MTIIDVSRHQGYIDWGLVKGNIDAAIIKATGEETAGPLPFRDARFLGNVNATRALGIRIGAYHFMDGGRDSASGKAEAEFFLKAVEFAGGLRPGDIIPTLDVEWPPHSGRAFQIEQLGEAVEFLRVRLGKYPMIYTGRWYWDQIIDAADFEELAPCPLWVASYTPSCPPAPQPWSRVTLWQYTNKGTVSGINGDVDMNRLVGTMAEIQL